MCFVPLNCFYILLFYCTLLVLFVFPIFSIVFASEKIVSPEVKANTAVKANTLDVARPIVSISTSRDKKGWVSAGWLKFQRTHGKKNYALEV